MSAERKKIKITEKGILWIKTAVTVIAAVCVGVLIGFILSFIRADVKLNDSTVLNVEYGAEFSDPGASLYLGSRKISPAFSGEGDVNTQVIGQYKIYYENRILWKPCKLSRDVYVVDTMPPVIELTDSGVETLPGHIYEEEGFSANDNYDGDLTDKVVKTEADGKVYYSVCDSSGNKAEAVREIIYGDNVAPVIKLKGESSVSIPAGASFFDPGAVADDNADGNISDKIKISDNYNTKVPGTYKITYSVTDASGNTAEAERTLVVTEALKQSPEASGDKVIYLTFDDGPGRHTPRLLEVLRRCNVKATFFVVGSGNTDYLDDIVADGHSIGLHTMTHDYKKIYSNDEIFMNEIRELRQIVYDKTGVDTTLVRFPGGSSNTISRHYSDGIMTRLTERLTAEGYQYFDWNVTSGDAGEVYSTQEVYRNVINGCDGRKSSVVLQHDSHGFSVDAVESIIQWGLANGYTFLPLTPSSPDCHHGVNN